MTGRVEPRDLHSLDCHVWTTHRGDCTCRDVDGQTAVDRARHTTTAHGELGRFSRSSTRHTPKGTP